MSIILGFDYGSKRIGIASGNLITLSASELTTLRAGAGKPDWPKLDELISQWQPQLLVVGLPLSGQQKETGRLTENIRGFGADLEQRYNIPVKFINEYLSSAESHSRLKNGLSPGKKFTGRLQNRRDRMAAVIILETYFNAHA